MSIISKIIAKVMGERDDYGNRGRMWDFPDRKGNVLRDKDIIFCTGDVQEGETETTYQTVHTEGVRPNYGNGFPFPVTLTTSNGELAYLKKSKFTKEILPLHAGCCPVASVIFLGPPAAGKTVYFLQLCGSALHNALAGSTDVSFADDMPIEDPAKHRYEELRQNFSENHVLPGRNPRGVDVAPYYFLMTHRKKSMILKIQDIDGEQLAQNMTWDRALPIYNSKIIVLTLAADDILKGNEVCERTVNNVIQRFGVHMADHAAYEVLVMITKADCFVRGRDDMDLSELLGENSIDFDEHGNLCLTTHREGFNWEALEAKEEKIRELLKKHIPNVHNQITGAFPDARLHFTAIASIGTESEKRINEHGEEEKYFKNENYSPYCIDEPLLYILTRNEMYPSIPTTHKEKEVDGLVDTKTMRTHTAGTVKRITSKIKKAWKDLNEKE